MPATDKATGSGLKAEISDFKRRRIREEASHLFFEYGYESTTIDAIAGRLDVTKPFIYSYYSNKSELLYDICRTGITLSLEAIDQASAGDRSASDRLRHLDAGNLGRHTCRQHRNRNDWRQYLPANSGSHRRPHHPATPGACPHR